MKMMWIVYDVDMEEEVMEALGRFNRLSLEGMM